jgi:very-short-patch-repair endonuclease
MTHAEVLVWMYIRKAFPEHHFRRQHPIGPYIADFACVAGRLVVEVDGGTHGTDEEKEHDRQRDEYLRGRGWRVIRFYNEDVFADVAGVLDEIRRHLPPPTCARGQHAHSR